MKKRIWEIIPDMDHMDQTMELVKEYDVGFEYNDFMFAYMIDQEEKCKKNIEFYKSLDRDRSKDTMHGIFLDIVVHSADPLIQEVSEKRVYQCMEVAQELGIRGVVFHTGLIANFRSDFYLAQWLDMNVKFWTKVLKDFPQLEVYIENMFDDNSKMCVKLAEAMKDQLRFGLCLDYSHVLAFGRQNIRDWYQKTSPYIRHIHINDNDYQNDLHQIIGDGMIDWKQFKDLLEEYQTESSILIEVKGYEAQKKSLEYLKEAGIF